MMNFPNRTIDRTPILHMPLVRHAAEHMEQMRLRQYSPNTIELFRRGIDQLAFYLLGKSKERLQDITAEDLDGWRLALVEARYAPGTIEDYLVNARRFFGWLEASQKLFINPAANLVIPRPPFRLQRVPTETEMRRLLNQPKISTAWGIRDRAMLELAYGCGLRSEELMRLSIFDIDLDKRIVRVLGKGRKERLLPLGKEAMKWIEKYLRGTRSRLLGKQRSDESSLWIAVGGTTFSKNSFSDRIRKYALRAKIRGSLSPHALRRACATHMLQRGAHPLQIQLLLGHSHLHTLSRYLRVTITDLQKTHRKNNPGK